MCQHGRVDAVYLQILHKGHLKNKANIVIVRNIRTGRSVTNGNTIACNYRKTFSINRTLVGNKIVDNPDVVGAAPTGAAPTTSSF